MRVNVLVLSKPNLICIFQIKAENNLTWSYTSTNDD